MPHLEALLMMNAAFPKMRTWNGPASASAARAACLSYGGCAHGRARPRGFEYNIFYTRCKLADPTPNWWLESRPWCDPSERRGQSPTKCASVFGLNDGLMHFFWRKTPCDNSITGGAGFFGLHIAASCMRGGTTWSCWILHPMNRAYTGKTVWRPDRRCAPSGRHGSRARRRLPRLSRGGGPAAVEREEIFRPTSTHPSVLECFRAEQDGGACACLFPGRLRHFPRCFRCKILPAFGLGDYGERKPRFSRMPCAQSFDAWRSPVGVIRPKTFIGPYRLAYFRCSLTGSRRNRIPRSERADTAIIVELEDLGDAFYRCSRQRNDDAACYVYNPEPWRYGRVTKL
jgi:hypothetical protein